MSNWDYETYFDGEDEVSPQRNLTRILRVLREVAHGLAPELQMTRSASASDDTDVELARLLGDRVSPILELRGQIHRHVEALHRALDEQERKDTAPPDGPRPDSDDQTFEPTKFFAGRKPIHLGVVDRHFVFPTSPRPSRNLLRLIIKVPGADELLVREQHDVFGWHYHYCDHKKRRSDILMAFDKARDNKKETGTDKKIVPLCWEPHAINKAKFEAKPWLWGDRKRMSIYAACKPDLAIIPALAYKPPSKEAEDVWPT